MSKTNLVTFNRDLKENMSSLSADLKLETLRTWLDEAELEFVMPAIGMPMYQALLADALNDKQSMALRLLKRAIVPYAIYGYAASGSILIDDTGITVQKSNERLPASDKKIFMLRLQCRRTAYAALETAIEYLEQNLVAFPEYATDAAHARNRAYYANSTREFSRGYELGGNAIVFAQLRSVMRTVEENRINPLLGEQLAAELKTAILSGVLSVIQQQLLFRITCALGPLTIAEAIPYRLITIDERGLIMETTKAGSDNVEQTEDGSLERLQLLMNRCERNGQTELAKLTAWLNAHADQLPGYQYRDQAAASKINDSLTALFFV